MEWAQVLVVILSLFLGLLLLAGVILVIMLIRLTHQIKAVTDNAERAAKNIENAFHSFRKTTSPFVVLQMIIKRLKKHKKRREEE